MKTSAFIIGLVFICCKFSNGTTVGDALQWECRDRYLWIHVASQQMPQFEAVVENGVHPISDQLASRCGYTISTFRMDGFTTFRASYYSCFTHIQNDQVFTFRFNVLVSDGVAGWISRPVSAVCSGLSWFHREVICEEDYMEVNVNRESSCGTQRGDSGPAWQAALSQAQRTASAVWQLMFLRSAGQVTSMSISEAEGEGYSLTTTRRRVVFRSLYRLPQAELTTVDGLPVEAVMVSLFFKQKLVVMMIDLSMACTVNSGTFDGARLLWDIPQILTPRVAEGAVFQSRAHNVGVEGVMLDQATLDARGFSLVQQGGRIQIGVPFGAMGGYRKSLVVNNVYKEMYVIFLLYEHIFSLVYEEGNSLDTRHRMFRVLDTPLLCRPPFSLDETIADNHQFSIYLGNIPADVVLEDIHVNGKRLPMSEMPERGIGINPVVHANGSRAYKLELPFDDNSVHYMYLGDGVVHYSIDVNFTLTIMPSKDSYYHHTSITARVFNAFPPKITAQCAERGISFSVVTPPRAQSRWEVGVNQEPLTPHLAADRGYRLHTDGQTTTLEVPVFSVGYTYEDINLSNFYGTFRLLLRDSKTLEVQTSTSKHCLFKTEDMIACSRDGTMTVVTTPTSTWPTVRPEGTSLLDPTCGPKESDGSRVLFEFKVDSCGTRAMVGDSYVVYENEVLHDRQLIADGPNFISRDSQFKLTVRCFYPLNEVSRLSVDRILSSEAPGFGSVKVFGSLPDSTNKLFAPECLNPVPGSAISTPPKQVQETHQSTAAGGVLLHPNIRPQPKPGTSRFIPVPGGPNQLLLSSQTPQTFPNTNLPPLNKQQTTGTNRVPLEIPAYPGPLMSHTEDLHVFGLPDDTWLNFPPGYDQRPDSSPQLSHPNTPGYNFVGMRREDSVQTDYNPGLGLDSSGQISPVSEQFESDWDVTGTGRLLQGVNRRNDASWYRSNLGQTGMILPDEQVESLSKGPHEGKLSVTKRPAFQPQVLYDQLVKVPQTPAEYNQDSIEMLGRERSSVPVYNKLTIHDFPGDQLSQFHHISEEYNETNIVEQNSERTGSVGRRNANTVNSEVKNIRVKPLRKLGSSGPPFSQKPIIKQAHSGSSSHSQYTTGATHVSSDGNHQMSQKLPDGRGSKTREEPLLERRGSSVLRREQSVDSVPVTPGHPAAIPNQQGLDQNSGGRLPASVPKKVQTAGTSHVRVKPALSLIGLQSPDHNAQPNSEFTNGRGHGSMSYFSLPSKNVPQTPFRIKQYEPATLYTTSNEDGNPTASSTGFTGSHRGPGGTGSEMETRGTSDCSNASNRVITSAHQGLVRGKPRS